MEYDKAGNHPYHHAGMIYIQDPGAMATAECLEVQPDWWVLDLGEGSGPMNHAFDLKGEYAKEVR